MTPFGAPSDKAHVGTLFGVRVVFLPRHGAGHAAIPSEINFRANLYALKLFGVKYLLSVSAVGSLQVKEMHATPLWGSSSGALKSTTRTHCWHLSSA